MPDGTETELVEPGTVTDGGDATAANDTPWNDYVSGVPELHREPVLDAIKHVEGITTQRFQDHAEFRKQMEPFKGVLDGRDPEAVATYLDICDSLEPGSEKARDVLERIAALHGLQLADQTPDEAPEGETEPEDPNAQRLAELEERFEQEQQAKLEAEFLQKTEASLKQVEKDNGSPLTDEQREQLLQVAVSFAGQADDPVQEAWGVLKQWRTAAQADLVKQKNGEPGAADTGPSRPAGGLPKVSGSMADAEKEVLALVRGLNP